MRQKLEKYMWSAVYDLETLFDDITLIPSTTHIAGVFIAPVSMVKAESRVQVYTVLLSPGRMSAAKRSFRFATST